MKLVEALTALRATSPDARPMALHVVCGFTPLHFKTFLAAHVQALASGRKADVSFGLFGDCIGNLERVEKLDAVPEAVVVALEWSDFDARLGLRTAGGWRPHDLVDIATNVKQQVERFSTAMSRIATCAPLRVSLPSLPLPPVSYLPSGRSSSFDLELKACIWGLGARMTDMPNVAVVNPQRLDKSSPFEQRRDVAAELSSGFPFTLAHASALAQALAQLVVPPAPKKGLITDLDDTLWRGLVGEVGTLGVTWDLDHKSHVHALYQQMLGSLAESGVLIAVASKNEAAVAAQVFELRDELTALKDKLYPVEVSWGPKSAAIGRILQAWNIAADSVVFIDDSPMELAEVQAAWPEITSIRFPKESDALAYALLEQLRDLFGKGTVSVEDGLRAASVRQAQRFTEGATDSFANSNDFLSQLDSEIALTYSSTSTDPRALELINKTNQYNLNGRRYTEGEWLAHLKTPGAWLVTVGYKDKFGPLGVIGAMVGYHENGARSASIDAWVLSCRAFSRRIEYATLKAIFLRFGVDELVFEFCSTNKNAPVRAFFHELLGTEPAGPLTVSRRAFESGCPPLYNRLKETPNE